MSKSAAFFRVEGALTGRPTLTSVAWLAANAQAVGERIGRLGNIALAAPFALAGPLHDAGVGRRMAFMALRGISEDRLIVLAEEYAARWLIPSLRAVTVDLLSRADAQGHRVVLLSDNLDVVMRPLADHLGVADLVCNRMEISDGRATGVLLDPVIGGHATVEHARQLAEREGFDLAASSAYGAQADDALLLAAFGRPCAVEPDRSLRRKARDLHWPVVDG